MISRRVRTAVRRIESLEGITAAELAEMGVVMLTAMSAGDRRSWRQLARQSGRREQIDAARLIGATAHEAWIDAYLARAARRATR